MTGSSDNESSLGGAIGLKNQRFSTATAQGPRATQEDRLVNQRIEVDGVPNGYGQLIAVMDGHGGDKVSDLLARELPEIYAEALAELSGDIEEAMRRAIAILQKRTEESSPGSTLAMAYISEGELDVHIAALGDSLIVIARSDGSDMLGPVHSAESHEADREEMERRGGTYSRGYIRVPVGESTVGLQPTRAFGDCEFKDVLIREPAIQHVSLDERTYVLLATDGLLDRREEDLGEQIRHIMFHMRKGATAQDLVDHTDGGMRTRDNVAIVAYSPDETREQFRCSDGEMIGELNSMLDSWEQVRFFHKITDYFSGVKLKNMHAHVSVNEHGQGILLLGEKGAGKSRLSVEMFERRGGYRLVCDDKLLVTLIDRRLFACCHPAFREQGILFRPKGTPAEGDAREFHHIDRRRIQAGFVRIHHIVHVTLDHSEGATGEVETIPSTEVFRLFRERLSVRGDRLEKRPALSHLTVISLRLPADESKRFEEADRLLDELLDIIEKGRGYGDQKMAQAPTTSPDWKSFH